MDKIKRTEKKFSKKSEVICLIILNNCLVRKITQEKQRDTVKCFSKLKIPDNEAGDLMMIKYLKLNLYKSFYNRLRALSNLDKIYTRF